MKKRRDRLQIIFDILTAIKNDNGSIRVTNILFKSNLSRKLLDAYLEELISGDFIDEDKDEKGSTYSMKPKGFEYLKRYADMAEFIDFFGA